MEVALEVVMGETHLHIGPVLEVALEVPSGGGISRDRCLIIIYRSWPSSIMGAATGWELAMRWLRAD